MRLSTLVIPAVMLVAAAGATRVAHGARISINGHGVDSVRGGCGGVSWNNTSTGEYGCMANDGSGIVCGGSAKGANKTCDTWGAGKRVVPKSSRAEIVQSASQAQRTK